MYAEIQAVITSGKAALDIAKAAHGLSNYNELVAAVSDVNAKLLQVTAVAFAGYEAQAALTARIQELEKEIVSFKNWEAESHQYKTLEIARGVFAHVHNDAVEPMHSMHKFCSNCFNQGLKSLLQQSQEGQRERGLNCHRCKSKLVFRAYFDEIKKA